ncbi:hypothetical protein KM92DES2_11627 [uncultured Desulfovibrio sp.]|uniref:Uncharacterized protein n=1 Tax=uncultured Desulfovibrio sp. TaxID=167968 RepID=A0A212JS10_9BACT|nr:hypothetical protein [Desulfovibrio desulfuricans]MCB6541364.1 hypothetical protein [Desulfovibrio desulfuricans]MCB6552446.1 hypothetical protein [Desulfovibrio desulfuricans]MCB6564307.1 hypothetical protein [Desulfovibrio desulfuricans]MCB7345469.1 hypothetical protein [Desulfovibrio desulfuricans]MCQ4860871.1 hypothetical protein [Desulfovibrio desulfuricans]
MDIQPSLLGYISIAKDWLTLIIAGCGVWVAWQGLRTWRRQLKGTSQFDVAKRLMLKVYQIRRDIEYCRSSVRKISIFTHNEDGKPIPEREQLRYSSDREMKSRFKYTLKTISEMDFLLFESEIILDKKLRELFQPIEEVCYVLRDSIEEYTEDYNQKNGRFRDDEERNRYRELRQIIYSRKGDAIQTKVNSAVREIEKFIKPYVHG